MEYYIGIDLGTSSVKLLLVGEGGEILNSASRDYPLFFPHPGWSEQNALDWWAAIEECIPELLSGFDGSLVRAIGVAGQMHGLVTLDAEDEIIRPTILWNDGRTDKETEYLNDVIGKPKLFEYTGNIAFAGFTAPKILWMRENEPENFEKIDKIMLPKDYIGYLLTGVFATDLSDAAGTLLLDVKMRRWSEEMLKICGITKKQLPALYESFEVTGKIKPTLAESFGINPDAVVIAGAGDNAASAIGTATVGGGGCNISLGTSGTVFVSGKEFFGDENQAIHAFCHSDGGYHLLACMLSAASCTKWFCEKVIRTDFAALEAAIGDGMLGKNEIFFLPYLMGERSPINDTDATGLFIGLRPDSTDADMYLALLEGVAFALKDNIEIIRNMGVDIKESCICGGGAKSSLWLKIVAAVLDIPLTLPESENGAGYGAALLSMVGAGKFDSVHECAKSFFKAKKIITPDGDLAALYRERYEKYKRIYPIVKGLYKELKQ